MKNLFKKIRVAHLAILSLAPLHLPAEASTAQFMTRLFTEALGRGVESTAWKTNAMFMNTLPCSSADFYTAANNIYTSAEYNNLQYSNIEKAMTLYRGILNREATAAEINAVAAGLGSQTISAYVRSFVSSTEFQSLRATQICTSTSSGDSAYRWGGTPAVTINQGESGMTASYLQGLLNAAKGSSDPVVRLPQRAVIFADKNIVIPANVTLTTVGNVTRTQYAKMARIVRTSNFESPIISIDSGGALEGIWISGQRGSTVNGASLNYNTAAASVYLNSGNGTRVVGSRFDTAAGNTNIEVRGEEASGTPCSNIVVHNNLITGYSNTHYSGLFYTDGITIKCGATKVTSNTVIDASDVGIILFYAYGTSPSQQQQGSKINSNLVIASGVPAFAAYMFEPYSSPTATPFHYDFSGASIDNNDFWSSTDKHFDIGIVLGGRAWHPNSATGKNAVAISNTNQGIATKMQVGIAIDGMADSTVNGNALSYVKQDSGYCPTKQPIVANNATQSVLEGGTVKQIQLANTGLILGNSYSYSIGQVRACNIGAH